MQFPGEAAALGLRGLVGDRFSGPGGVHGRTGVRGDERQVGQLELSWPRTVAGSEQQSTPNTAAEDSSGTQTCRGPAPPDVSRWLTTGLRLTAAYAAAGTVCAARSARRALGDLLQAMASRQPQRPVRVEQVHRASDGPAGLDRATDQRVQRPRQRPAVARFDGGRQPSHPGVRLSARRAVAVRQCCRSRPVPDHGWARSYGDSRPFCTACMAAWVRLCTFSLVKMLLTYVFTVCWPTDSSREISLLERPRASRSSTSTSRRVRFSRIVRRLHLADQTVGRGV